MKISVDDTKKLIEATDLFSMAILEVDPNGVLPELVSMVGQENAMRLIDIFGGMTIKIPTKKQVAASVRNACIWVDYEHNKVPLDELCVKYSVTMSALTKCIQTWTDIKEAVKVLPEKLHG